MSYKVKETKGFIFSVSLADGSTLTLQPGKSAVVKDSLVSESLKLSAKLGRVVLKKEISNETKNTGKDKNTGGAK